MRQDAIWRANLRRDAEKLGRELTRRRFLGAAGAAMAVEYTALRKTYAMFLRGGSPVPRDVKEITNTRTGITYKYIAQAIYTAETADEIILPAGLGAHHDAEFAPYASWQQLKLNLSAIHRCRRLEHHVYRAWLFPRRLLIDRRESFGEWTARNRQQTVCTSCR